MLAIGVIVWWYRRRLLEKAKRQATPPVPPAKDVPARAEDVLNRPDPSEKPDPPVASNNVVRAQSRLSYGSHETNVVMGQAICSPPPSHTASAQNPFDDTQSIQTTGTHGSNVIQIALVPPVDPSPIVSNSLTSPSRLCRSRRILQLQRFDRRVVSDFSVSARCYYKVTNGVKRETLDCVAMTGGGGFFPLRPVNFPPSSPSWSLLPSPKESRNSTFRSTPPGAWAARAISFQNASMFPSHNNSSFNHPPQVRPNLNPTSFSALSNFLSQLQSRPTRLPLRPAEEKHCAGKGWSGSRHWSCTRVKPNGMIRRSDSNSKKSASKPAPVEPSKQRLIIEQGSTPLYCSDERRLADLNASYSIVDSDYNPSRQSPPPPPVPYNSFSSLAFSVSQESESDSSSVELTDTDGCHARLALLYGFSPLQLHPHLPNEPEQKVDPSERYQSGIMMAAQRIEADLCKEEPKRSSFAHPRDHSPCQCEFGSQEFLQRLCCFLSTPRWRLLDPGCQVLGTSAVE